MQERVTRTEAHFSHPFFLAGIDGVQAPGTYDVETIEELINGLSFVAYRRISTTIAIGGRPAATASRQIVAIDPADLTHALDVDQMTLQASSSS